MITSRKNVDSKNDHRLSSAQDYSAVTAGLRERSVTVRPADGAGGRLHGE
jgi:hypothetical protein